MAIDSRQKRQSAYKILLPFMEQGVHPSGAIGQAQQQAAAWVYSGILATAPVTGDFFFATMLLYRYINATISEAEYIKTSITIAEE